MEEKASEEEKIRKKAEKFSSHSPEIKKEEKS